MSSYDHANTSWNSFNNVTIADFSSSGISLATCIDLVSSLGPKFTSSNYVLSPIVIPPSPALGLLVLGAVPKSRPIPAPHRHHPGAQYMGRPLRQRLLQTAELS